MAVAPIPRPHGGVRGADLSRASLLFGGPFGRMFRALPPAEFGKDDAATVKALTKLAKAMLADPEPIKNGPDGEESGIPAAFTYFGQFIDHDLHLRSGKQPAESRTIPTRWSITERHASISTMSMAAVPTISPTSTADGLHFNLGRALTGAAHNPQGAAIVPRSGPDADARPTRIPRQARNHRRSAQ